MRRLIKSLNLFLFFLLAPFTAFYLTLFYVNPVESLKNVPVFAMPTNELNNQINNLNQELMLTYISASQAKAEVQTILEVLANESNEYLQQQLLLDQLVGKSSQQAKKSDIVLEQILSNLLGEPIFIHQGELSTIKIYTLVEAGYRGYMAKVSVNSSDALKLVLAEDQLISKGEKTSQAAERTGAILAINAGGFIRTSDGKITPLGTTIVDGDIKVFSNDQKLSLVGFNEDGQLSGGKFASAEELAQAKILQGSSFRPTLLQNGEKLDLSSDDLATAKHPRTIIGNFSNGELLFMVIDGRREGWSTGVTLTEIQDKLLSFKVKDAFNLDGGGSSAFYYDGVLMNKPSDGVERAVTSNLIILP